MLEAAKFRKKPIVIEAMQWDGSIGSASAICQWANVAPLLDDEPWMSYVTTSGEVAEDMQIDTLEGPMHVSPHDWIIKGVKGEFYPCKPDIFDATYEEVVLR